MSFTGVWSFISDVFPKPASFSSQVKKMVTEYRYFMPVFNPWRVMHKEIRIPVRRLCMTTMHRCVGWLPWCHPCRLCNEKRVCRCQEHHRIAFEVFKLKSIGLESHDVTKLSNAWQRWKLVLNKDSTPYKSMLREKSLTGRSSLFLRGEVGTVLTTSQLSASHFKRYQGSDKCGAVFRSIDDLLACFCMRR